MKRYLDRQRWRALLFAGLKAVPSVTVLMGVLLAGSAAGQYQFTNIGDTSGSYRHFLGGAINNSGGIAVNPISWDGTDLIQIWRDGSVSTIYDRQELPGVSGWDVADVNDTDAVVIKTFENAHPAGLYVGQGGPLTTVVETVGFVHDVITTGLNNSGQVAYEASGLGPGGTPSGNYLFTGVGDPTILLAHSDEGFEYLGLPQLNDAGEVAFGGTIGLSSYLYFRQPGQPRTVLLEGQRFEDDILPNVALNNLGQVLAVTCSLVGTEQVCDLSIVSSGGVVPLADTTGPFRLFRDSQLHINDHGDVAFQALLDGVDLHDGIFTGPDTTTDAVVVEGDTLFGSQLDTLSLKGFNNRGEITFWYRLDNGVTGIALATAVPSPDFNGDGVLSCTDIDALVAEIVAGTHGAGFDLTSDGFVDTADLDQWRVLGGAANLPSGNPYLEADANLDGIVDGLDFITWNANKFTSVAAWCSGDFNADGIVNGQDFDLWYANKFRSSDSSLAVPEPGMGLLLITALIGLAVAGRR